MSEMVEVSILDTSALLNWPPDKISTGICVEGQMKEVVKFSQEKAMLLESQGPSWEKPRDDSILSVKEAAAKSGDISGLSQIDIQLIALAYQYDDSILFTDDYRMMNVCSVLGVKCNSVVTKGITEYWRWIVRCSGCGKRTNSTNDMEKLPNCEICGSPQKIKRAKK